MAYVPVPKDLSKIKTKLAFNLTKRQLVCFSSAAAVGLPAYLFSRGSIGNSAAMFLMIGLMLPFFFLAMYERDGLPLEKVLKNIIRTRFLYPRVRPYKTENFYALLSARKEAQPIAKQQVCTPLLSKLYVNGSPETMALATSFTLWCMPQIFFRLCFRPASPATTSTSATTPSWKKS